MSALQYGRKSNIGQRAFSRVDLLIIIAAVALVILAIPSSSYTTGSKVRAQRISCVNNLRQIGIASREWAREHSSNFVWQTSMKNGGTAFGTIVSGFLTMTNELRSPKLLTCPSDKLRQKANSFADFSQKNISYFIALDCPFENPQAILAGDRNVKADNSASRNRVTVRTNTAIRWDKDIHESAGNLLLADGSSQMVSQQGLANQIQAQFLASTNASITWLLP